MNGCSGTWPEKIVLRRSSFLPAGAAEVNDELGDFGSFPETRDDLWWMVQWIGVEWQHGNANERSQWREIMCRYRKSFRSLLARMRWLIASWFMVILWSQYFAHSCTLAYRDRSSTAIWNSFKSSSGITTKKGAVGSFSNRFGSIPTLGINLRSELIVRRTIYVRDSIKQHRPVLAGLKRSVEITSTYLRRLIRLRRCFLVVLGATHSTRSIKINGVRLKEMFTLAADHDETIHRGV